MLAVLIAVGGAVLWFALNFSIIEMCHRCPACTPEVYWTDAIHGQYKQIPDHNAI